MAGCLKIESAAKHPGMVAPAISRANHLRDSSKRQKSQSGIPHHQPEPRVSQRCESWHHSFGDATVISCRSPELDPVADGGVFSLWCRTAFPALIAGPAESRLAGSAQFPGSIDHDIQ